MSTAGIIHEGDAVLDIDEGANADIPSAVLRPHPGCPVDAVKRRGWLNFRNQRCLRPALNGTVALISYDALGDHIWRRVNAQITFSGTLVPTGYHSNGCTMVLPVWPVISR
jgi:hypothetical protein